MQISANARLAAMILVATLGSVPSAQAVDTFAFTVAPASTATWSLSATAPFALGGASHIIGNYDATTNPSGTRTIPGLTGGDTSGNTPVPLTAGNASVSASSGASPVHPAGTFRLVLDPEALRVHAQGLTLDLVNGQPSTATSSVSITYATFRTRQPTCLIFGGFPISVPIGAAAVTGITATQVSDSVVGVLAPTGPDQYTATVTVPMNVAITATLAGAPLDVPVVEVPVVITGNVMVNGDTASLTAAVTFSTQQSQPGPIAFPQQAFAEPLCGGNLLVNILAASVDTAASVDSSIMATGVLQAPACDADVTGDGNVDQDDVAYLVGIIAGGPNPIGADPDFNQDGNADQDDVRLLVGVVAGQPCPF